MDRDTEKFWKQAAETEKRSAKILADRRRQEQAATEKGGKR